MAAEEIFTVLANPIRRRILQLLLERAYTVNSLVEQFKQHRPAVSEHLHVLRKAKLVRDEKRGRERYYHIEPARLLEAADWLRPFEHYWRSRMHALSDLLDSGIVSSGEDNL